MCHKLHRIAMETTAIVWYMKECATADQLLLCPNL